MEKGEITRNKTDHHDLTDMSLKVTISTVSSTNKTDHHDLTDMSLKVTIHTCSNVKDRSIKHLDQLNM
jgi:hypothetical protein